MKVPIRRVDTSVPLPEYKTPGAVAMDCAARVDAVIPPQEVGYVPLNIVIKPPRGHWVLMAPRSSLHKRGLMLANSIGVFDEDFCGDEDEYRAALFNFTHAPVEILKGERITQLVFVPYDKVEWSEVESHNNIARGGFGSTGI